MAQLSDQEQNALAKAIELTEQQDSFAAASYLESTGDAGQVGELYSHLLRALYFEKKNVPAMVMLGRAGIQFCLRAADREQAAGNDEVANELRGIAKTISYNLGANTWPGWDDEGITINRSDLAAGWDAASLNLRLAQELKRGDEVLGNAHWLAGAHRLAVGDWSAANEHFLQTKQRFQAAGNAAQVLMAEGYLALTEKLAANTRDAGAKRLSEALADLEAADSDEAKFFAQQIQAAEKVFARL